MRLRIPPMRFHRVHGSISRRRLRRRATGEAQEDHERAAQANHFFVDGFQIYLHAFALAASGEWAVVQQGLNDGTGTARRYHWHSPEVRSFTEEPHTAIVGEPVGTIRNLVDRQAGPAQRAMLAVVAEPPERVLDDVRRIVLPRHHDARPEDVDARRLGTVPAVAHDRQLHDFASLLLVENLGPRTLQSLALVAEVVHGTPTRFRDPARFAFAHGGKDGHPFPVPLKVYDETIDVLRRSLAAAAVGRTEKLEGMKRLDRLVRAVDRRLAPEADVEAVIARERAISDELGGRTVVDDSHRRPRRGGSAVPGTGTQLDLF